MPFIVDREFLESYPLYKSYPMSDLNEYIIASDLKSPTITMPCLECKSSETFVPVNRLHEFFEYTNHNVDNEIIRYKFLCAKCQVFTRVFFVHFASKKKMVSKIGQYPSWDISGDKAIEKVLGSNKGFYRRALICESQGFGIASFAYYRRIVEITIDKLINDIKEMVSEQEITAYNEVLDKVSKAQQASEKISLAKEHLPEVLRPNGMNPLGVLYQVLSEGIHSLDEQDCLDYAEKIRVVIGFLVHQIEETKMRRQNFSLSLQAILEKKR